MTFTDAAGIEHARADPNARIVSVVPSLTETLFALGLGGQVIGRTKWCIHPDQVEAVLSLGGTKKINMKRFAALEPTHAVLNIDENPKEMFDAMQALGVETIVTHPNAPEDNRDLYRLLGGVFGCEDAAEAMVRSVDEALTEARSIPAVGRKRVLYLIWKDPWMTVSRDTYIARYLAEIGWDTVGHDDAVRYPEFAMTPESLADLDLVLFSSEPYEFNEKHLEVFAAEYDIPRKKLFLIDGEMTSWYGVRAIEGLRYGTRLARDL